MTKARSNSIAPAAKGELQVGNGSLTSGILSVGSNDQVLTADSSASTGLKWAAPTASVSAYSLISTTRLLGSSSYTFSGLSSYNKIYIDFETISLNAADTMYMRINGSSTSSDYVQSYARLTGGSSYSTSTIGSSSSQSGNTHGIIMGYAGAAGPTFSGYIIIDGAKASTPKVLTQAIGISASSSASQSYIGGANFNGAAVSDFTLRLLGTTFSDGYIRIYGSAI